MVDAVDWRLTKDNAPKRRTYELRYWSKKFGVSHDQLKAAVSKVGVMADDVARELGKSGLHSAAPLVCP
jgi:uncharacterized protein DUF3606